MGVQQIGAKRTELTEHGLAFVESCVDAKITVESLVEFVGGEIALVLKLPSFDNFLNVDFVSVMRTYFVDDFAFILIEGANFDGSLGDSPLLAFNFGTFLMDLVRGG